MEGWFFDSVSHQICMLFCFLPSMDVSIWAGEFQHARITDNNKEFLTSQ